MRCAAANAVADMRAVYSWRTWLFGWLGRMLAQVTFFTLVGRLLGSAEQVRFLVVGNAAFVCAIEALAVVASTTWERNAGTLPLLLSSPANLGWVFVGRSLQWPVSGTATSLVSLFALAPLFGVRWQAAQLLPVTGLVALTATTTYCVGLFLGGIALFVPRLRNTLSNATYLLMMAFCGVQLPARFWPGWVQGVASAVPVTHTLSAIRVLHDGGAAAGPVRSAGIAAAEGVLWLSAALLLFNGYARAGRRSLVQLG